MFWSNRKAKAGSLGSQVVARSKATRSARPHCELLEGRALLSTSSLDSTFGQSGVVLGPLNDGSGSSTTLNTVSALAVQADGKIVEVETQGMASGTGGPLLIVRRYNATGTADTSFGANGSASIPLGNNVVDVSTPPHNLAIQSDGKIVLAAESATQTSSGIAYTSLIVRLTDSGQLDTAFAAGGEVVLPNTDRSFNAVAIQGDGKILAAGVLTSPTGPDQALIVRLTSAGAFDSTFNQGGRISIEVPNAGSSSGASVGIIPASLAIGPNGVIYLASNVPATGAGTSTESPTAVLSRVNGDGTPDITFTPGGTLNLTLSDVGALAVQSDGNIVLAGATRVAPNQDAATLIRLLGNGAVDPSFRGVLPATTSAVLATGSAFNAVTLAKNGSITIAGVSTNRQFLIERFLGDGSIDSRFGYAGRVEFSLAPSTISGVVTQSLTEVFSALALTPSGNIVAGGHGSSANSTMDRNVSQSVLAQILPIDLRPATTDYDGDKRSDIAAQLSSLGVFAIRKSTGGDLLQGFGISGAGATIPAPGDYDGDGRTDVAAYLPSLGWFAYRPSSGGPDVLLPFGSAGPGASIPAPGDYDGDGRTDVAVYLPAFGGFAIVPSGGTPAYLVPFGSAGPGASIPAPGDYDGDGRTDVAAYLPSLGWFAYRPSSGGPDVLLPFGSAGPGASIPAPGDYDGDGRTDVAVYLPAFGGFAIVPSGGTPAYLVPFGSAGPGASIPAPGDYDGDGRTDVAVYLPAFGGFAIVPSSGRPAFLEQFGIVGSGETIPASSIPYAQQPLMSAMSLEYDQFSRGGAKSSVVYIPLIDEAVSHPKEKIWWCLIHNPADAVRFRARSSAI